MSEDQEREKLGARDVEGSASDEEVEAHKLSSRGAADEGENDDGDDVEAHRLTGR